jgi:protein gp37
MGISTKIEWCDHTWSPWRGCEKVSEGCKYCYAEIGANRNPQVLGVWGKGAHRALAAPASWQKVRTWNDAAAKAGERRRLFFSLGDPFEDRPDLVGPRDGLFKLIEECEWIDFLLLTKRPGHARVYLDTIARPPENLWLGTSVETQYWADARLPVIRQIKGLACRFVSYEPALDPIDFAAHADGIDWLIIGGESHRARGKARPCDILWIRHAIAFARSARIPIFVKQLGSQPIEHGRNLYLAHSKGGDWDEWPEDLRVRQFPGEVVG